MSNRNKLNKGTIDDAKKVENQEGQAPVTPEIPDEKGEGTTDKKEEGGNEETGKEKEKFHLPKIHMPKIPLPSKETLIRVLKDIALLLLGSLAGAVAIVSAAIKINSANDNEESEEEEAIEEVEEPEEEEEDPDEPEESETAE